MRTIKNTRKQYDTGLGHRKGTRNIRMRFADGIKIDESTHTDDWDEAQIIITRKRTEVRNLKLHGIKMTVTFDEAWNIFEKHNAKHWAAKTHNNEKNMFDRMMGRATIRQKGKGQSKRPPVYWTGISVDCLSKITASVLTNLYTTRLNEGSSISLANQEIAFIRRLIAAMHIEGKRVPTLAAIKIKLKHTKNNRMRVALASEINEICSHLLPHHRDYIRCLALTGSRSQEMAKAMYSNIKWVDGEMVSITLEDTKNDQIYSKPLIGEFGAIIKHRYAARNANYDWIFPMPNDASRSRDHSLEYWYRAIEKTDINSEKVITLLKNNNETLTVHHLRHFVGVTLAGKGYSIPVIMKQLNHSDARSSQLYIDQVENPHALETANVMNNLLNDDNTVGAQA